MQGVQTIGNATLIAYDDAPILSTDPWMGGDRTQDTVGSLFLQFHEQKDRELRGFEIVDLMRQRTSQIPGIVVEEERWWTVSRSPAR